ncbi:hypothetical protein O0I10_012948 [Lichtheimia ornata]|uniref:Reverse transcriptase domain-containing protein n=1 Tax=Lichtheimia ornata TaxID=688661 RepID=A0AAD7URS3_9FUNG|nr:uncharacterized protein O0I10_012948 [Lichtheimia ornata]KAJ8651494.1 hypothetical protein O0I10_012948 [Lichtheimia ornata]
MPESVVYLDTGAAPPVYRPQYPLAEHLLPVLEEQIQKWLADGLIIPAPPRNGWNSPLTVAPKKDAQGNPTNFRPCLDPRHINNLLPEHRYPLPHIEQIFHALTGATVFTTLDLKSAFHRFKIHEPDQHKTTFTFRNRPYCFQACPFGLKHISAIYLCHLQKVGSPQLELKKIVGS